MSERSGSSIPIPDEIERYEIACCHTHGLHGWKQPEGPRKWCYVCDGRVERVEMVEVADLPKVYEAWAESLRDRLPDALMTLPEFRDAAEMNVQCAAEELVAALGLGDQS